MMRYLPLLLAFSILTAQPAAAAQGGAGEAGNGQTPGTKMDCGPDQAWCKSMKDFRSPGMGGRCGKRRGDWYGASQPVASAEEARKVLSDHFVRQGYRLSEIVEGKWGFTAEIIDKDGRVIDRVMIDKRFGRIRSVY